MITMICPSAKLFVKKKDQQFCSTMETLFLLHIKFMFGRCHHCWVAVTLINYGYDLKCKIFCKIWKFEFMAIFLNLSCFDLESDVNH